MDRKATDKKLQRAYGITLEQYEQMLKEHDGGCWICGWKPQEGHRALAVEHDHKVSNAKLKFDKVKRQVVAAYSEPLYVEAIIYPFGISLKQARVAIKKELKRVSVRGLVCWACNILLKKGRDNPEILEAAARYLRNYKEKFGK